MANKKISQLMDSADNGINATNDYFVLAEKGAGGIYSTVKATAGEISEFVLNPVSATQISGLNKDVYLNNNNWINSTAGAPPTYGFLMIRAEDGLLTTGSGIGTPVNGDNLGNHTAIQSFNLNNQSTINANEIYFGGTSTSKTLIQYEGGAKDLKFQAETDATLSGQRYARISGQALHLANTPISGDVTFTGGHVRIDPAKILYVNEINTYVGTHGVEDRAVLSISGAARFHTNQADVGEFGEVDIDWSDSNIQYDTADSENLNYIFTNVRDGQTVTMYIENTSPTTSYIPTFTSGSPNSVLWGGTGGPPDLAPNRTNVYTFAAIHTGIFASAITGYVY